MKPTLPAIVALFASAFSLSAAEPLRMHEWGTFTTLHGDYGQPLSWYQVNTGTSDLPKFVQGNLLAKMGPATARMETPVIYFYTEKRQTVSVKVNYKEGLITEFFPGKGIGSSFSEFGSQCFAFTPGKRGLWEWPTLELIPPSEAGELLEALPMDKERPDNHYFEARAVPEAALVKMGDQVEKFVFYRGAGALDTRLHTDMRSGGKLYLKNYSSDHAWPHVWAVHRTEDQFQWKQLSLPALDPEVESQHHTLNLNELGGSDSEEALVESMKAALTESGLTPAESAAMVATWDEQWYHEPGQRVFTIVPQAIVDAHLPLTITPTPTESVRVFVHRAELLSPETFDRLEVAMGPETEPREAAVLMKAEKLGRFVDGAMNATAQRVGQRITQAYSSRGFHALSALRELAEN